MANLARQKSELIKTGQQSSLDLVLGRSLDLVSQVYKTEMMPGEVRVWRSSLAGERPETVEWAFGEYFKVGKFPPKPADIMAFIRDRRESLEYEFYHAVCDGEKKALAEWKASPAYQELREEWMALDKKLNMNAKIEPVKPITADCHVVLSVELKRQREASRRGAAATNEKRRNERNLRSVGNPAEIDSGQVRAPGEDS